MTTFYIVLGLFALCLIIHFLIYYCLINIERKYKAVCERLERSKKAMETLRYYSTGRIIESKDEKGNDVVEITFGGEEPGNFTPDKLKKLEQMLGIGNNE
jgi:hypothetical protein